MCVNDRSLIVSDRAYIDLNVRSTNSGKYIQNTHNTVHTMQVVSRVITMSNRHCLCVLMNRWPSAVSIIVLLLLLPSQYKVNNQLKVKLQMFHGRAANRFFGLLCDYLPERTVLGKIVKFVLGQ